MLIVWCSLLVIDVEAMSKGSGCVPLSLGHSDFHPILSAQTMHSKQVLAAAGVRGDLEIRHITAKIGLRRGCST